MNPTVTLATSIAVYASASRSNEESAKRRVLLATKGVKGMKQELFSSLVGKRIRIVDAFGHETTGELSYVDESALIVESRWEGQVIVALEYVAKVTIKKEK